MILKWLCFSIMMNLLILQVPIATAAPFLQQETSSVTMQNENKVDEAIKICREKLANDPLFPRVQYSLAQLLDSRINSESSTLDVNEVINLYHSVGKPSPQTPLNRIPPSSVRFKALYRAATLSDDILHDLNSSIRYFVAAIVDLEDIGKDALISAFQAVMPLLLSSVVEGKAEDNDISNLGFSRSLKQHYLETSLTLCSRVTQQYPEESIADEYKGATLRKMKQLREAYESYQRAMLKSKTQYLDCDPLAGLEEQERLLLNYVRISILVAAAGRAAGLDSEEQMSYLTEAEKHLHPFVDRGQEFISSEYRKEVSVDLYNNMGIIEKKRESIPEARAFFMKALEIKSNDGHALVQLASIEGKDGENNEGLRVITELDAGYVAGLFDGYSSRFESELVDLLEYRGHILVYNSIKAVWKQKNRTISSLKKIIDLGCGTGLLGELISNDMPFVDVHGVDLSRRMVDISRDRKNYDGKNVYTTVTNEDGAKYLSSLHMKVDCILASDVFIYVGDISKILEQSALCLEKDGLVGFTIEQYEHEGKDAQNGDDTGIKLLSSGRFGHSRAYIERVAISSGFGILSWQTCILRKQGGDDVKGAVIVLQKIS